MIPSDRLIVGDVAFGKTEVILRAIFLAAKSNLQSVVLVPTTDYTISGTNLTFATAPGASAEIQFRYLPIEG